LKIEIELLEIWAWELELSIQGPLEKSNFMNLTSNRSSQGTQINWNAFTSVNEFIVLALPNGIYLLTPTLDLVWVPTVGLA
jgi:hypothetical protein